MANKIVFEIQVDGKGQIKTATAETKKLKKEVDSVGASYGRGTKAAQSFATTQNKGVIGTARNSRDFSKLSQTIGSGDNGLVGAYATLAANTFAVTAAFVALKSASNSLKVMEGLAAQGARLGKTLSSTANSVRELTGDTISLADAMRTTAQLTAAGFGDSQSKALSKVAKDAAGALGRDTADALDRLTRGVTKLEPELLDEIGIMIKLDEASRNYATSINKSAASLTAAEKRQAYFNAVIEEGDRKFSGIGDKVEKYDAYTRLAATATDTFNTTMGTLASVMSPVVELFADNKWLIASAVVLYASTIKDDLLPALGKAAEKQAQIVAAGKEGLVGRARALAEDASLIEQAQQKNGLKTQTGAAGLFLPKAGAKELGALADAYEEGTVKATDFRKAQSALDAQLENATEVMNSNRASAEQMSEAFENSVILKEAKANVSELNRSYYQQEAATKALNTAQIAQNTTMGTLIPNMKKIKVSLGEQFSSLQAGTEVLDRNAGGLTGLGNRYKNAGNTIGNALSVVGTGARAAGSIFLNVLPVIGQVMFAVTLLSAAYSALKEALTTKEQKAFNSTLEELEAIIEGANERLEEYNKLVEASTSIARNQSDALRLQGNAVSEVTAKLAELEKQRKAANEASLFGPGGAELDRAGGSTRLAELAEAEDSNTFRFAGTDTANNINANIKAIEALGGAISVLDKDTQNLITARVEEAASLENSEDRAVALAKISEDLGKTYGRLAITVENLNEAYKNLETSTTAFIQSATQATPVDALFDDLTKTTTAIAELSLEMNRGALSAEDFGKVLSGIGAQSKNLLGDALPSVLELENMNSRVAALKDLGDEITDNQKTELRSLQASARIRTSEIGPAIQQELQAMKDLVRQNQVAYRLAKDQLALENARFSKVKDLFDVGAAGYLAREEHEEKVRGYQAAQLDLQINLLEAMNSQAESTLAALQAERDRLSITIERAKAEQEITRQLTTQERLIEFGLDFFRSDDNKGVLDSALDTDIVKQGEIELQQLDISIQSAKDGMLSLQDSIESLRTQKAVLLAQNLSKADKAARAMGEEFELTKKYLEQVDELVSSVLSTNQKIAEYNRIVTGTASDLGTQVQNIADSYEKTRYSLIESLRIQAGSLNLSKEQISALKGYGNLTEQGRKAAEAKLSIEEATYANARLIVEQKLKEEEVAMRLQLLSLAIYDNQKEGLEWQKEALSYEEKRADLQADIVSSQLKINAARRDRSRIRSGLGETDQSQKNDAVRAAIETLNAAKAAASVRMAAIEAEYALLNAQKIALEQDLKSRVAILKAAGASKEFLAPIQNAVSVLEGVNVSELKDLAIKGVRLEVGAAEEELKTALVAANQQFRYDQDSFLAKVLQDRRDKQETVDLSQSAQDALQRRIAEPISKVLVAGNNTGIDEQTLQNAEKSAESLAIMATPMENMAADVSVIKNHLTGTSGGAGGDSLQGGSLRSLVDELAGQGYGISRGPGYGGTPTSGHSRGSKHYTGNAYDINIVSGNDADNPRAKAMLDKAAKQLQAKGKLVIWNGKVYYPNGTVGRTSGSPHRDHLHVQEMGAPTRGGSAVSVAQQTVAKPMGQAASGYLPDRETFHEGFEDGGAKLKPVLAELSKVVTWANEARTSIAQVAMEPIIINAPEVTQNPFQKARDGIIKFREEFQLAMTPLNELAAKLGEDGELVLAISTGFSNITNSLAAGLDVLGSSASTTSDKVVAAAAVASAALSSISQITSAASSQRVRGIEAEIAAEQKRDGQSEASQKKIAALEKKKDQIAKKQFETNKKLMMAQAVIGTAAGIAQALGSLPPPASFILAGMIGAMGAAQLAVIAGTSYQSANTSSSSANTNTPQALKIGKVGSSVNVDRKNTNAGGEVGYLRGSEGYGSSASNFRTVGSAYGGSTHRGYGHRAFLVGEKGPETIETSEPMNVNPGTARNSQGDTHVYISATDADSFQKMLKDNPGPMIEGMRKLANSNGKAFMEDVDISDVRATKR